MAKSIDAVALFTKFASQIEGGKKLNQVSKESKIKEFGIDSVSMMEIIGLFEDEFNVRIPDEKLATLETVGDIEKVILEQMPG